MKNTYFHDIEQVKRELQEFKGPMMNHMNKFERENESIMRELNRTQSTNRELITEYQNAVTQSQSTKNKEKRSS